MGESNRALDTQAPLFKKPLRSRRKHKIRKRRSPKIRREIFDGPLKGFSLTYDRTDPIFPRQWILRYKGILVQVSRSFPTEKWDLMVKANSQFIESPEHDLGQADRERREYLKGLGREIFWDDAKKQSW